MIFPFPNIIHQFTRYRHFRLGVLTQGNPDRITDTVTKKRTDSDSALDTPVLTVTRLRYPKVQGVMHILGLHRTNQQPHGPYHDNGIGSLNRNNHIREILLPANAKKLHTTRYHPLGRITITAHDTIGERAMIHTDTNSGAMCLTNIQERDEPLTDLLDLGGIFLIRIFKMAECLYLIYIVSRIDTYLFHLTGGGISRSRIKMDISDQRSRIPLFIQLFTNLAQVSGFPFPLCRKTHILSSRLDHTDRLSYRRLRIHR